MNEQVLDTDYSRLLIKAGCDSGIGHYPIDPAVYDRVLRMVRPATRDLNRKPRFTRRPTDRLDDYRLLALEIARVLQREMPLELLESRYSTLQYHTDKTMPYRATNAVVIFAEGISGGELVFPDKDLAVPVEPGWLITFDGARERHGVAAQRPQTESAWRVSLTYYLPR